MLTVACVWFGPKYGVEYVERLRDGVARHLSRPYRFVCITDHLTGLRGVDMVAPPSEHRWPGWWAKMNLFDARPWYRRDRMIYLDLDTVIVGDLSPLADWPDDFGICANFTKRAGLKTPCNYGSCVMSLAPGFGGGVFSAFTSEAGRIMEACPCGDQQAIEQLRPCASYLQDELPPGFFLHYRNLTARKPDGCAVVIFAGSHKPIADITMTLENLGERAYGVRPPNEATGQKIAPVPNGLVGQITACFDELESAVNRLETMADRVRSLA
jgi:hypothetical protein